jgi:hypothetical protein
MNIEQHMSRTGVVIFDDMIPRNSVEAFRIRRTSGWPGDVNKVHQILQHYRPDLTLVPIKTNPTGSYRVVGIDPASSVLDDHLEEIETTLASPDPQVVPTDWLERRAAVDAGRVLQLDIWKRLVDLRETNPRQEQLPPLWDQLRSLPTV